MNGIRLALAFNASISAISSARRSSSSSSASSASSWAIVSGLGRRSATRRASARVTVGQLEIVEEQVDELFLGQHEAERVLAVALARCRLPAAAVAGARQNVAFDEL